MPLCLNLGNLTSLDTCSAYKFCDITPETVQPFIFGFAFASRHDAAIAAQPSSMTCNLHGCIDDAVHRTLHLFPLLRFLAAFLPDFPPPTQLPRPLHKSSDGTFVYASELLMPGRWLLAHPPRAKARVSTRHQPVRLPCLQTVQASRWLLVHTTRRKTLRGRRRDHVLLLRHTPRKPIPAKDASLASVYWGSWGWRRLLLPFGCSRIASLAESSLRTTAQARSALSPGRSASLCGTTSARNRCHDYCTVGRASLPGLCDDTLRR